MVVAPILRVEKSRIPNGTKLSLSLCLVVQTFKMNAANGPSNDPCHERQRVNAFVEVITLEKEELIFRHDISDFSN